MAMDTLKKHWAPTLFAVGTAAYAAVQAVKLSRLSEHSKAVREAELAALEPMRVQVPLEAWQELTPEDVRFIKLTRDLLHRSEPPIHSKFLVAATISYWRKSAWQSDFVQGVNSETCVLPSAICAERTALLQLRLRGDYSNIRTVYITTSAPDVVITPGLLCREMLCEYGPPQTRVVLFTGDWQPRINPMTGVETTHFKPLRGQLVIEQLGSLYPHRPIYHNIAREQLAAAAAEFAGGMQPLDLHTLSTSVLASARGLRVMPASPLAVEMAAAVAESLHHASPHAGEEDSSGASSDTDGCDGGAGRSAAAAATGAGAPTPLQDRLLTHHTRVSRSLSLSVPTSDAALRVLERRIVALYRTVHALAARAAGPVCIGPSGGELGASSDSLYPINFAAGVLFSDGSVAVGRQDKCLEYGCSVDAVTKLIPFIEQKMLCGLAGGDPIPWYLHDPAAQGVLAAHAAADKGCTSEAGASPAAAVDAAELALGAGSAAGGACACCGGGSSAGSRGQRHGAGEGQRRHSLSSHGDGHGDRERDGSGGRLGRVPEEEEGGAGAAADIRSPVTPGRLASSDASMGGASASAARSAAPGGSARRRSRSRMPGPGPAQGAITPVTPIVVLHVDQHGICHAPHAQARAWLSEYGYGDCAVLLHAPPTQSELHALQAGAAAAASADAGAAGGAGGVSAALASALGYGAPGVAVEGGAGGAASAYSGAGAAAGAAAAARPVAAGPAGYSLVLKRVLARDLCPGAPHILL